MHTDSLRATTLSSNCLPTYIKREGVHERGSTPENWERRRTRLPAIVRRPEFRNLWPGDP